MGALKTYCGNSEAFVFVYLSKTDEPAGRALLDALAAGGRKLFAASAFGPKEKKALHKAAAAVLFLSGASAEELAPVVSAATKADKPLVPVYLDDAELPAGLRLLLGPKQGHLRSKFADDAECAAALLASPVLRDLAVTPAQKRAARGLLLAAAVVAVAAAALVLALTLRPGETQAVAVMGADLTALGLSGDPAAVETVYLYGGTLRSAPEPYGAQRTEDDAGVRLYLPDADETISMGTMTDAADFAQLTNLRELALAGNAFSDLSPLWTLTQLRSLDLSCNLRPVSLTGVGALQNLETLNLACCRVEGDLSELLTLPKLRQLVLSEDNAAAVPAGAGFDVLYTEAKAADWPGLKAAAETPWVYTIDLVCGELVIPEGETLTIRKNVQLSADWAEGRRLVNRGALRLEGTTRLRMDILNEGAVTVAAGGDWHGAGGSVENRGSFTVAAGGAHTMMYGETMTQTAGEYVNDGALYLTGGSFAWNGGRLVNNGVIWVNGVAEDGRVDMFTGDLSAAEGDGEVRTSEGAVDRAALQKPRAQLSEEIAALLAMEDDPTDKDADGLTPRERAVYAYARSLDFLDFGAMQENLLPIPDTDRLDILQTPRNGNALLLRDMTLSRAPDCWYTDEGIWAFVVAPGATVTVEGDLAAWTREAKNPGSDPNDIWFTVMEGGTLVVNGELPFSLGVNHGELIVNGKLFSTAPYSQYDDLLGVLANDGTITVAPGGVCLLSQLWSFAGAEERGEIAFAEIEDYENRYDFTDRDCPFNFEHGVHGFRSFFLYMLDPDRADTDMFVTKFWDW